MRSARVRCALLVALVAALAVAALADDDAARGYATIRPSLVKVWAFDASGKPVESGSGIVIVSNASRSLILTAAHVIAGAASIKIDLDRDRHDVVARVQERGPRDLAVLAVDLGHLSPATFAPHARVEVEGNVIAVAGYVKNDELIGVVGQEPRLLYPGTISSRPDDGAYLELENVHVEEGLSGGPVFDAQTGDVLGVVTSRTSDGRGGFADSASAVVVPFLASNAIAFREREPAVVAKAPPTMHPAPRPSAHPAPTSVAVAVVPATPRTPPAAPRTAPPLPPPAAPPTAPPDGPHEWAVQDGSAHRVVYYHNGCAVVLLLAVQRLAFGIAAAEGPPSPARLTLRVARRVSPVAACDDIAESSPADAAYEPLASSFDGHHVTVRFRYVAAGAVSADEAALFPADVSLDADVNATPVTAHMQFIDADWDDALDVTAARDR